MALSHVNREVKKYDEAAVAGRVTFVA
jgi:hypothetical protein